VTSDLHGVSPERLRAIARADWDGRFGFTCACLPRETRFEPEGMVCARCDRPIARKVPAT
jgi:hypothetical protein